MEKQMKLEEEKLDDFLKSVRDEVLASCAQYTVGPPLLSKSL